jgi:hypothetical protein
MITDSSHSKASSRFVLKIEEASPLLSDAPGVCPIYALTLPKPLKLVYRQEASPHFLILDRFYFKMTAI